MSIANRSWAGAVVAMAAAVAATTAPASVVLRGTRVVYPADARDVTLAVENEGQAPVLVQSWIDGGDPRSMPDGNNVPFVLTPPLFRLDSHRLQSLRIIYTRAPLPADRESVFWLNVLSIPPRDATAPAAGTNRLDLLIRTRIKIFFRPKSLKGEARMVPASIRWAIVPGSGGGAVLRAENPTDFHVSFSRIEPVIARRAYPVQGGGMIAPGATQDFPLRDLPSPGAALERVDYSFVDDFGAVVAGRSDGQRSD